MIYFQEESKANSWRPKIEELPPRSIKSIPSSVQPPKPDLKSLPFNLKYSFLRENETFLVIISSNAHQEGKLLQTLKIHINALGRTIADIKGISHLICTHMIYWDDPYLFKYCPDQIFRRCIPNNKVSSVIKFCHSKICGGHFSSKKTTAKILQCGFYWPTMFKDTHAFCKTCENYQKLGSISKCHMMPLNPILVIEIFGC